MQNFSALSDEALLQLVSGSSAARQLLLDLHRQEPHRLARLAEALLASTQAAEAAEAMMEASPSRFEPLVAAAAERGPDAFERFRLWRAVFRRYPGHYRERIFDAGRQAMAVPDEGQAVEVAVWMTDKFGHEVVPDLVDLMHRREGDGLRVAALQEAVKVLGPGAVPVAEAALESGFPALVDAAHQALHRLGAEA